jgi:ubiquinone/menaquinone biosynthesis C-methylase UbiE
MRVLDVGAGTGALTRELVARVGAENVAAAEPSPEFERSLRTRFPGVDVRRAPAESLPFADDEFDVALAQLVVTFMDDAPAGIRELRRVARTVAICMWGIGEVEMFAAIDRTQQAVTPDVPVRRRRLYRTPEELRALLADAGLAEVATTAIDVAADYGSYDEFWRAFDQPVGPTGDWLASLDEEQHDAVREELHRQLGSPAGPFVLTGRAYAARATRA